MTNANETDILLFMKSTRDKILQTLLRQPRTTINELAAAVGINPISVRHHLTNLQVEGLVGNDEERHGVGRPRLVYFLTEAGMERFPTRYLRLTTRLLAQMKESMPAPMVSRLFAEMADGLAEEYASIHEITCPYLQIGQSHPEVCTVDQTLISKMLAVPAEKVQCVLQGDAHCTYVVQAEGTAK